MHRWFLAVALAACATERAAEPIGNRVYHADPPASPVPAGLSLDPIAIEGDPSNSAKASARQDAIALAREAGILAPIPGEPPPVGPFDRARVASLVEAHRRSMTDCYEIALATRPDLSGTVTVHLAIGRDGRVTSADASAGDPTLGACASERVRSERFPVPPGPTTVTFEVRFRVAT